MLSSQVPGLLILGPREAWGLPEFGARNELRGEAMGERLMGVIYQVLDTFPEDSCSMLEANGDIYMAGIYSLDYDPPIEGVPNIGFALQSAHGTPILTAWSPGYSEDITTVVLARAAERQQVGQLGVL